MGIPFIGPLIEGISNVATGWINHRQAKTEAKRDVELKQITASADIDATSAADMSTSWKDEYLTVLFSIPLVVVFYASVWGDPADIERVKTAFAAMQELPEWYMWSVVGIVTGTFGLRGLQKLKR